VNIETIEDYMRKAVASYMQAMLYDWEWTEVYHDLVEPPTTMGFEWYLVASNGSHVVVVGTGAREGTPHPDPIYASVTMESYDSGASWDFPRFWPNIANPLVAVAYSQENKTFMAVSRNGHIMIQGSDGKWLDRGSISTDGHEGFSVVYGKPAVTGAGVWVVGSNDGRHFYSTDNGNTWAMYVDGTNLATGVAYSDGWFYLVSDNGTAGASNTGTDWWTGVLNDSNHAALWGVASQDGLFITAGDNKRVSYAHAILHGAQGNWIDIPGGVGDGSAWRGVTISDGECLIVGDNGQIAHGDTELLLFHCQDVGGGEGWNACCRSEDWWIVVGDGYIIRSPGGLEKRSSKGVNARVRKLEKDNAELRKAVNELLKKRGKEE
jgi:hypothetical protein